MTISELNTTAIKSICDKVDYFEERNIFCGKCGCFKFNTVIKNKEWKCRKCGELKY